MWWFRRYLVFYSIFSCFRCNRINWSNYSFVKKSPVKNKIETKAFKKKMVYLPWLTLIEEIELESLGCLFLSIETLLGNLVSSLGVCMGEELAEIDAFFCNKAFSRFSISIFGYYKKGEVLIMLFNPPG